MVTVSLVDPSCFDHQYRIVILLSNLVILSNPSYPGNPGYPSNP